MEDSGVGVTHRRPGEDRIRSMKPGPPVVVTLHLNYAVLAAQMRRNREASTVPALGQRLLDYVHMRETGQYSFPVCSI